MFIKLDNGKNYEEILEIIIESVHAILFLECRLIYNKIQINLRTKKINLSPAVFLVCLISGLLDPTNHTVTGDNIAYIYPDQETVFLGKFENKIMRKAKESSVLVKISKPNFLSHVTGICPNNEAK